VSGIVTQELKAIGGVPGDDRDRRIIFNTAGQVPELTLDPDRYGVARQTLANIAGDFEAGDGFVKVTFGAVR
jgi:hypothetical protein